MLLGWQFLRLFCFARHKDIHLRYQNMRANALTDAELRRKAADELVHMTARINRGEAIPEPVKQLPVMGGIWLKEGVIKA